MGDNGILCSRCKEDNDMLYMIKDICRESIFFLGKDEEIN
jgi:hypothetical protein